MKILSGFGLAVVLLVWGTTAVVAQQAAAERQGTLVRETITSAVLRDNRIGLDVRRNIVIYLPPGYTSSGKAYPVVYYCRNIFQNAEQLFSSGRLERLLNRAFSRGVCRDFILVAADYSSSTSGSLYENSSTSGRWLDFTTHELVPFIDGKFRTLRSRDCRAVVGDFMGGRGALKLGMTHADLFSVVYALHPVATGRGYIPWSYVDADWSKIYAAKTFGELAGAGRSQIMVAICQAFLPNPNRPPFYCDFFMEPKDGVPVFHVDHTAKIQDGFLLERTLDDAAVNLRSLRGLAFDWARYDQTASHIVSAVEFSRKLDDLGIEHEAEEYRGNPWDKLWTDDGRFYSRLLPFVNNSLVFEK